MVTEATVAVNPAVEAPADTVTLPGTVAFVLLLESVTGNAAVAGPLSVTEHEEEPGALTVAGVQLILLRVTGAFTVTVAVWLCPFQVAVTATD